MLLTTCSEEELPPWAPQVADVPELPSPVDPSAWLRDLSELPGHLQPGKGLVSGDTLLSLEGVSMRPERGTVAFLPDPVD